ncbi:MAG: hypothetical protein JSU72_02745 [Deltaproteobacteria bacterium]|nr:MAG: hypothetical protein JSU72_02745 [Deltaproteobacteria bacterium]
MSDLSDRTLLFLISPGDQNIFALYELVMGVRDLGGTFDFYQLEKAAKMEVIDISVYLLDQLRFESMRRLTWLESSGGPSLSIVELVEQYPRLAKRGPSSVPALAKSHPKYQTYMNLSDFERETFIRKQIPAAIEEFRNRLQD